jgi:hypothetical protein
VVDFGGADRDCCCGRLAVETARALEGAGKSVWSSGERRIGSSVAEVVVVGGVLGRLGSAIRRQPLPLFLMEVDEMQMSCQRHGQNQSSQGCEVLCTVGHYQTW